MNINHRDEQNRRPSVASCERIILYVDGNFATATSQDSTPRLHNRADDIYTLSVGLDNSRMGHRSSLYPPNPDSPVFQLGDLYPLNSAERLASSNLLCSQTSTPRRSRCNLDVDQRSSRRSSITSHSRTNSCSRPTPLGRI